MKSLFCSYYFVFQFAERKTQNEFEGARLHTHSCMHENRQQAQQQLSFPPALIFVGLGAHARWEDFSAILRWKNKSSWNNLCLAVPLCDVHEIAGDANLHPGTARFFSLDNGNRRRCHK
jgi:hypothetical protein